MVYSTQIEKVKHGLFPLLNDSLYLNKSYLKIRRSDGHFVDHQASLMARLYYTVEQYNYQYWHLSAMVKRKIHAELYKSTVSIVYVTITLTVREMSDGAVL